MSRIGKKPVPLPKGVTAQVTGRTLVITGPKGEITRTFHPEMTLVVEENTVVVRRPSDESFHKALHALSRTPVANMVAGVTEASASRRRSQASANRRQGRRSVR